MTLTPLPAFTDNYIWIIEDKDSSHIWAVDPGDANVVVDFCQRHQKILAGILITHHHKDHTGGVRQLKQANQCQVIGPHHLSDLVSRGISDGESVEIFGRTFRALETPAHTLDHICYYSAEQTPILLSGDTLFRGGCGRLMEGTAEQMLAAMDILSQLPDDTQVYCTHEYTLANYRFALSIDPDNQQLIAANQHCQQLRQQQLITLPSTIGQEKHCNPFMRSHVNTLVAHAAQQLNEPAATDRVEAFAQVRRAKDTFS